MGEKTEYFSLYQAVADAVKELRQETKMHIPLGGPSTSCWFANAENNNMLFPERSLIYELIKYCSNHKLPLDFISWHAYSSDPYLEKQDTIYGKSFIKLIREWLSYFNFKDDIPLVIDEWNFDSVANISPRRGVNAYVVASYIPARVKSMQESGIDLQTYFCMEDFGGNDEKVARNLGIFAFDQSHPDKLYAKAGYNTMRMLNLLGDELISLPGPEDEFVGLIPTKSKDYFAVLVYNYIDPDAAMNYLSRKVVALSGSERKTVVNIVKSDRIDKIISGQADLSTLRMTPKVREMFSRAVELNDLKKKYSLSGRKMKITFKGVKGVYLFSRYVMDNSCSGDCPFSPREEKEIDFSGDCFEEIEMSPYSVQLLLFKKKPLPPPVIDKPDAAEPGKPVNDAEEKTGAIWPGFQQPEP
ncbi:MAG: hypothetical protein PHO34_04270 [Candidatus Omnitrophica bacterium]|nr:hypothetical protein [Candidatus Omnitrophota bacterium]